MGAEGLESRAASYAHHMALMTQVDPRSADPWMRLGALT